MLYLHIGSPKAGSTSIQAFLTDYRDSFPHGQIEAWGVGNSWKIAAASGTQISRDFWVLRRHRLTDDRYQRLGNQLWDKVRQEVKESPHKTFVASTEHTLTQVGSEREAVERLKTELLDIFGEVKLIIYLRDQVSYVKSLYSQRVKGPLSDTSSFEQYVINFEHIENAVRYEDRIEIWASVFGEDRIDAVVFARENFVGGNLIADFLSRVSLVEREQFLTNADRLENKSPSFSELNILRRLNRLPIITRWQAQTLASFMQKFRPVEGFPHDFDEKILEIVSDSNERLNEKYFSDLPVKLPVLQP